MKKSITRFMSVVNLFEDGRISGGFGSIKGGLKELPKDNFTCSNSKTCGGSNVGCTNSGDCDSTTNKTINCSNTGTCFA